MTELQIFNPQTVAEVKTLLKDWKPQTKDQAGAYLALRSAVSSTAGEAAKKAAEHFLENRCGDCEVHEFAGFSLKKVTKTVKTCRGSAGVERAQARVDRIKAELKEAEIKLKAEQELAGFDESPGVSYWLVQ
jgi:hypothetical protein